MELRPYQRAGVAFLAANDTALLADEMGLGKTIQAISAIAALANAGEISRVLIVTPASLQTNWKAECERWAPDVPLMQVNGDQEDRLASYNLPVLIQLATYDQVRMDSVKMSAALHFDLVILDEAQRIKNADSLTALSCRLLGRKKSWALTGTPLENRVSDIVGVFRFLNPDLLRSQGAYPHLSETIKPYVLRRRLLDVIPDLPDLIDQTVPLELARAQRLAYQEVEFGAGELAVDTTASPAVLLALITRLKQICNYDEISGESVKLEALQTILEECTGRGKKVLLFSQYVETLEWLSPRITTSVGIYHGGLSAAEKDATIEHFKAAEGSAVLLMSLKAGGVGLNLQEASVVILFDRWWNPAAESQAVARAHRMGQKEPVLVYRFLVRDSIEERIQNLLDDKTLLFDEHVNSLAVAPPQQGTVLRTILAPR
jgi:SNF2 family DNA or RNA helicase